MPDLPVIAPSNLIKGATGANADSSRSHAILQIVLKHQNAKNKVQGTNR